MKIRFDEMIYRWLTQEFANPKRFGDGICKNQYELLIHKANCAIMAGRGMGISPLVLKSILGAIYIDQARKEVE